MDRNHFRVRARFRHALRNAQVPDGARLLVAVSGGSDSVALLRLAAAESATRGWTLTVGHIDHRWRPDSAGDALWVRSLAEEFGLPSLTLRARASAGLAAGDSREEGARRLRRRGLRRLARQCGASFILLGHTRDDQAETVLLQLLRGSGWRGLAGMARRRGIWVRPLLEVGRDELRTMLRAGGHSWREDPTNADERFLRNRIRRRLLPLLRSDFQPGIDRVLGHTAAALRQAGHWLGAQAGDAWGASCLEERPGSIRLDRTRLRSYHPAVVEEVMRRAVVRLCGTSRDLGRSRVAILSGLACSTRGGTFRLPGGLLARFDGREIRLTHPIPDGRKEDGSPATE